MTNKPLSKLLSLMLRHRPEALSIELDEQGWALVEEVLRGMQAKSLPVDLAKLQEVVSTNCKQRFLFNTDGSRIRANQGHSIPMDLGLVTQPPPSFLYPGTAQHKLSAI